MKPIFSGVTPELITSFLFFGLVVLLRYLLVRMVRRDQEILTKEQRRWIMQIKSGTFILLAAGLVMIWAPQLHTFALSLAAFAVALVVATKEMILCLMGSLLRVSARTYKVGDWITLDGIMGEVMDIDAFSTRVEEIDPKSSQFTGKKVIIPNSKLFTSQVENKNFAKNYTFQDISLVVQSTDLGPSELFEQFQSVVSRHMEPLLDEAEKFTLRVARKAGIDFKNSGPSFGLRTTDLGHYVFMAKIFIPTRESEKIILSITKDFLDIAYRSRQSARDRYLEKQSDTVESQAA